MGKSRTSNNTHPKNRPTRTSAASAIPAATPEDLRQRVLDDFGVLHVPLDEQRLDEHLSRAEQNALTPLQFLAHVIGEQANRKRERAIERRIHNARFAEVCTLAGFDWEFNAKTIDRGQIEQLVTCDFLRRQENLVLAGQSGLGKSRIVQSLARHACVLGYSVRYITSGELFADLTAALADQTLPKRVRYYCRFDLLVIDEFGFDRIEREQCTRAAGLLYKIIDSRGPQRSTALVTNIDFEKWADYLDDPPLAMAVLDRIVDGAIVLKLTGKSYRAHRAKQLPSSAKPTPKTSRHK